MEGCPERPYSGVGLDLAADCGVGLEISEENGVPAVLAEPLLVVQAHGGSLPGRVEAAQTVHEDAHAQNGGDGVDDVSECL